MEVGRLGEDDDDDDDDRDVAIEEYCKRVTAIKSLDGILLLIVTRTGDNIRFIVL